MIRVSQVRVLPPASEKVPLRSGFLPAGDGRGGAIRPGW